MIDIPANDLVTLILYDIHQWKTTEKSYKNYKKSCEILGKEAISYEDYEYLFNEYLKKLFENERNPPNFSKDEKSNSNSPILNLKWENHVGSNKYWFDRYSRESYNLSENQRKFPIPDIRLCVLSDIIDKKSAENSFNGLCDAFAIDFIDKKEHLSWYERFIDKRYSFPTFSQLPNDVISEIVEKCDLKTNLQLRKVSHDLRHLVDRSKPAFTDIQVACSGDYIILDLNFRILVYSNLKISNQLDFPIKEMPYQEYGRSGHNDLKFALSHPKLRLNSLRIDASSDANHRFIYGFPGFDSKLMENQEDLFSALRSPGHKIYVKSCSIYVDYEMDAVEILRYLKPETLKSLTLEEDSRIQMYDRGDHLWRIRDIAEMEQWKRAEHLRIGKRIRMMGAEIRNFFHFKTFDISVDWISIADVMELVGSLSNSPHFKSCCIQTRLPLDFLSIEQSLQLKIFQNYPSQAKFPIPNSNLFIEFFIPLSAIKITCF